MNQVVVVGAGPTGVTLALLLVKQGISVTLIEAARDFRRIFRGEGLMPSGLNALQEMELLSLVEKIPHTKLDAWEFFLNKRSLMRINEPLETGEMPCTLVSQPHFLAEVVKKASHYPNFTFIKGEAVRELLKDEQERFCGVRLGSGREFKANLVVAADGRNSPLRKQAGLELERFSSAIDILWFKLSAGSLLQSENIFGSILQDRSGFGLFRGSEGELHIGWGLHKDDDYDWKQVDWRPKLAAASPEWLAKHIEDESTKISQPLLLSVVVGRCPQWYKPGLLLLGDAIHPMSPIRAQGINMAFRDVIVASNYLIPELTGNLDRQALNTVLDAVLPKIQAEREPEIIRIQQLQDEELAQAEKLRHSALLRSLVSQFAPLIRPFIRFSWLKRQKILRQGIRKIRLYMVKV
jgi:2-polyprenyl-6-methoxyphenol hydroxylase-like FAD-dependent oxidoreductase